MLTPPPSAFAAPEDAPDDDTPDDEGPDADARSRWQLRLLDELAEMGMDLARAVHRRGTALGEGGEDGVPPPADAGLAFSRVSRTVRLTLALGTCVQAAMDARRAEAAQPATAGPSEAVERLKQLLARKFGGSGDARYEDVFADEDEDEGDEREAGEREAGLREFRERLVEVERDPDVSGRPVGEVIGRICRDLGVAPDWGGWAQEAEAAPSIAPPLGELPAKPAEGDFDSPERERPLHHAARGPPPPRGEGGI